MIKKTNMCCVTVALTLFMTGDVESAQKIKPPKGENTVKKKKRPEIVDHRTNLGRINHSKLKNHTAELASAEATLNAPHVKKLLGEVRHKYATEIKAALAYKGKSTGFKILLHETGLEENKTEKMHDDKVMLIKYFSESSSHKGDYKIAFHINKDGRIIASVDGIKLREKKATITFLIGETDKKSDSFYEVAIREILSNGYIYEKHNNTQGWIITEVNDGNNLRFYAPDPTFGRIPRTDVDNK